MSSSFVKSEVPDRIALDEYGSSSSESESGKKHYRRFAIGHSTERHFRIAEHEEPRFYGAYGQLRKQLDYSYHFHYRKERQWLHDSIIDDYLEAIEENEPENMADTSTIWLILTVGVHGAGKQHSIRALIRSGHLPLISYVLVDSDSLRRCLPEYEWYLEHAPELVGDMTRKEAGYIAETLCLAALRRNKNVIWDCAPSDSNFFVTRIKELRDDFPSLKVALMHVTAKTTEILERCKKERKLTGREIPESSIAETMYRLGPTIEKIKEEVHFDFSCLIRNHDDTLEVEGDQNFEVFAPDPLSLSSARQPCRRSLVISREQIIVEEDNCTPQSSRLSFRVSHDLDETDDLTMIRRAERRVTRRRISFLQSSEINHMSDDTHFYGRFAHIRRTLDYTHHKNYTFERQKFQDAIIMNFLKAAVIEDKDGEICTTPTEPWLCFTAGPMGAGKSYTKKKLVEKGRFPLLAFVNVDPDEIRRQLPEYHLYIIECPDRAGELTRKESGYISEILTLAGLEAGKNVLVDGSLRDAEWYQKFFARIQREFPIVKIAILQVTAPREAIFERAAKRAKTTGRSVPKQTLEDAVEQVPRSVKTLAPLVDYHVELLNAPDTDDIEIVTEGETWESFKSRWTQTCAWIPRKQIPKITSNPRLKETSLLFRVRPDESQLPNNGSIHHEVSTES